jgi:hypothetical protein
VAKINTGKVRAISVGSSGLWALGSSASEIVNNHPMKSQIIPKGIIRVILRLNFGEIPMDISKAFELPVKVTLMKFINQVITLRYAEILRHTFVL